MGAGGAAEAEGKEGEEVKKQPKPVFKPWIGWAVMDQNGRNCDVPMVAANRDDLAWNLNWRHRIVRVRIIQVKPKRRAKR